MMDPKSFIHAYASEDYDPVKAHEYYMRTRELKGRPKGSAPETKSGRRSSRSSKATEAKRRESQALAERQKVITAQIRAKAQARREQITTTLRTLITQLSERTTTQREQLATSRTEQVEAISKRMSAQISKVPKVPKGVSPARRTYLAKERAEKIAKIRGEAQSERDKVVNQSREDVYKLGETSRAERKSAGESANKEKEAVAIELKSSLDNARIKYNQLKQALAEKYERAYDRDYQNSKR